jgi:hypothetical protein
MATKVIASTGRAAPLWQGVSHSIGTSDHRKGRPVAASRVIITSCIWKNVDVYPNLVPHRCGTRIAVGEWKMVEKKVKTKHPLRREDNL